MKPEQFAKLAEFMRWKTIKPFGRIAIYVNADGSGHHGKVEDKTSLTDAEAVEALDHESIVAWHIKSHIKPSTGRKIYEVWFRTVDDGFEATAPTIPAAVEAALLALIEREG